MPPTLAANVGDALAMLRVAGAVIRVRDESIGFNVSVRADSEGRYYVFAIPNGPYEVTAEASGFRAERIEALSVDVGQA